MTARPTHVVRHGEQDASVAVLRDGRVAVGDEVFTVAPVPGGMRVVAPDGRAWLVHVAGPAEQRWVHVDGRSVTLAIRDARAAAPRHAPDLPLTSPMPATVLAVLVEPGQQVEAGDLLVRLEAMKMELPVRASRAGQVTAVRCTAGERVEPGVPLVELS